MNRVSEGGTGRKSMTISRYKYMFILTTIVTGGYIFITARSRMDLLDTEPEMILHDYNVNSSHEMYTIETKGCRITAMKPMDDSIKHIVKYPSKLKPCPHSNVSLLGYDENAIWIRKENINHYDISEKDLLLCCYQGFKRPVSVEDITSKKIDNRVGYENCVNFNETITVKNEFVKVTCSANKKTVYEQYYAFTPEKKFIKHDDKKEFDKNKAGYNILIMGIDSVSRLNFHRTMPKTANFLKKKGAVELLGYNKVGDNTYPNLMAMLLGLNEVEVKKTCLPHNQATFDNCPFIWEWFKQEGYYTALAEDTSVIGTFNYIKAGFANTPTDYYLHTFIHEAEQHVGKIWDFNSYLCMQDRYFYKVLLDYISSLTMTLKNKKLFGFFWEVSMTHDYLNYPMVMDNDYLDVFNQLENNNYLDDTIVFLVSDHGMRWGDIRSTKQGRLEERLPFVFMLTPESFQKSYKIAYRNLQFNTRRLTSPFDIHATLKDLIDLKGLNDEAIASRSMNNYADDRSISLFLPIHDNRTCSTIGIADHWCTCLREVKLPKDNKFAVNAASSLVKMLNSLLVEYPQCANLTLSELLDVVELDTGKDSEESTVRWRDFMVVIKTIPGGGIFEGTLRNHDENWKLMGSPSRLNLYGDQSRCVDNAKLKLYCYCDDQK